MLEIILIIILIIIIIKIYNIYFNIHENKSENFINITNPFVSGLSQAQLGSNISDNSQYLDNDSLSSDDNSLLSNNNNSKYNVINNDDSNIKIINDIIKNKYVKFDKNIKYEN